MIIDWEHHFIAEEIYRRRGVKAGQPLIKDGKIAGHMYDEVHQIDKHIEFMDEVGIDTAVLSDTLDSVEDCRLTHDVFIKLTNEFPGRLVGLAHCIPTRGKDALDEMERAINAGLKGVLITPQNDGVPLDSRKLWPFYEQVSRLKVPIFVHVTFSPVGYSALDAPYNLNVSMTREFDVAAATVRLILGGVLANFPDLEFVMPHMGGGISSILERTELYLDIYGEKYWRELGGTPPFGKPYRESFKRDFGKIYFDLAGFEGGMNALKCALTTISPERLLFGTDYPFNFTHSPERARDYIRNIRELDLPSGSAKGILGSYAAELLGL